jgi:hypothetical protein
MTEKIFVSEDGVQREATPEEVQQFELDKVESQSNAVVIESRKMARTSALAKLAALGLTEEEIAAL